MLDGLCAGRCVDYVLGRVVFLGFIPKYGVYAGMVLRTILLYVVLCCMFTKSLRCVFISLRGDAFVYGSAILTFVLGVPNLCGQCSKSAYIPLPLVRGFQPGNNKTLQTRRREIKKTNNSIYYN